MRHRTSAIHPTRRSTGVRRRGQPVRRGLANNPNPCRHDHRATLRKPGARAVGRAGDPIDLAAATWLACGIVLLVLTPLPLHEATLGWTLAFWLLAAPAVVLLARRMFAWPSAGTR